MKFRALIIAITLTAMLFIPMTAAFQGRKIPREEAENSLSTSSEGESAQSGSLSTSDADKEDDFTDLYFRIYDLSEKKVVNIGYEDYVRGAIAAEMGAGFEFEAMVAQGTAALSCALYEKNTHFAADYDFTATAGLEPIH